MTDETILDEFDGAVPKDSQSRETLDNITKEIQQLASQPSEDKKKKKPIKEKLADDIMELSEKMGIKNDREVLVKMKMIELKKMLAELVERASKKVQDEQTDQLDKELGARSLYRGHLFLVQIAEAASKSYSEYLGSDLEGMTALTESHREELEEILGRIYLENKEILKPIITATTQYLLFNLRMFGHTFIKNKKKVTSEPTLKEQQPS